jgi:hypothetical protein
LVDDDEVKMIWYDKLGYMMNKEEVLTASGQAHTQFTMQWYTLVGHFRKLAIESG